MPPIGSSCVRQAFAAELTRAIEADNITLFRGQKRYLTTGWRGRGLLTSAALTEQSTPFRRRISTSDARRQSLRFVMQREFQPRATMRVMITSIAHWIARITSVFGERW